MAFLPLREAAGKSTSGRCRLHIPMDLDPISWRSERNCFGTPFFSFKKKSTKKSWDFSTYSKHFMDLMGWMDSIYNPRIGWGVCRFYCLFGIGKLFYKETCFYWDKTRPRDLSRWNGRWVVTEITFCVRFREIFICLLLLRCRMVPRWEFHSYRKPDSRFVFNKAHLSFGLGGFVKKQVTFWKDQKWLNILEDFQHDPSPNIFL